MTGRSTRDQGLARAPRGWSAVGAHLAGAALLLAACTADSTESPDASPESVQSAPTQQPIEPLDDASVVWQVDFVERFDDLEGSPALEGAPGLPVALFAEDGSRWTQLQNSHEGLNTVEAGLAERDGNDTGVLMCRASGQPDGVASKADLGRAGFSYGAGDRVRITVELYLDPGGGRTLFFDNTLIDLEDTTDVLIDGTSPGAGLRIRSDEQGRLALDRGEIPGRESPDLDAVPRLSTLRSDHVLPVREWFTLEVTLQLGIAATPESAAVDTSATEQDAWVVAAVTSSSAEGVVLARAGTNIIDPAAVVEVFERESPEGALDLAQQISFDSVQVCATNNRSTRDVLVMVDDLVIESAVT